MSGLNAFIVYGIPSTGGLIALLCLIFAFRAERYRRAIRDLPTVPTTGVFVGLVELEGTAEAEHPLTARLSGKPCVHYSWQVEEHWESSGRRNRDHPSGWTTVAEGKDEIPFYLQDDSGLVLIHPAKAEIKPATSFETTCDRDDDLYYAHGPARAIMNSTHRRRLTEYTIPLHSWLYVVGHARERKDVVAPEIAYDPNEEMFIISTQSQTTERGNYDAQASLFPAGGLIAAVAGFCLSDYYLRLPLNDHFATYVLVAASYGVAWSLGWLVMLVNSLIRLRQRVRQAWANVEVQLKRRHDLIVSLVTMIRGLRDHERTVQTELARMRDQLAATAPGKPGPDPETVVGLVRAVAERYPALTADSAFLKLQETLIDTESRIAMARDYFNAIATALNTRTEIVPDRYIAALLRFKPSTLMEAAGFEQGVIAVDLAG